MKKKIKTGMRRVSEVEVKCFFLHKGLDMFLHRPLLSSFDGEIVVASDKKWRVSELRTVRSVAEGKTVKKAIANATEAVDRFVKFKGKGGLKTLIEGYNIINPE